MQTIGDTRPFPARPLERVVSSDLNNNVEVKCACMSVLQKESGYGRNLLKKRSD